MSFDDPTDAPVTVSRATFLAIATGVIGLLFIAVAATGTVGSPSPASPWVISGLGWLIIAVYVRLRPDIIDRGQEPAPRVWFEYSAVVGAVLVATLLIGVALV